MTRRSGVVSLLLPRPREEYDQQEEEQFRRELESAWVQLSQQLNLGTRGALSFGTHLTGTAFNGLADGTLTTDATPTNTPNAIVSRDGAGGIAVGPVVATTETLTAAAPTVATGQVGYGATVQATVGAAGAGAALPATPAGYLIINVAGTNRVIPYYAAV